MTICYDTLQGDALKLKLNLKSPNLQKDLNKILYKIKNLGYLYIDDFIVVELIGHKNNINFIQVVNESRFNDRETCVVEIGTMIDGEKYLFAQYGTRNKILKIFKEVIEQKNDVDFNEWKDVSYVMEPKCKEVKQLIENAKACCMRYLAAKEGNLKELFPEFKKSTELLYNEEGGDAVLWYLMCFSGIQYYKKVEELFKENSGNPWLLKDMGDIEYYGYLRKPNYKKAFNYYSYAGQRGSVTARFRVAEMYRDGIYVKKDYNKYVEETQKAYDTFLSVSSEAFLPCIEKIVLELSKIEEQKGNIEKAIFYAEQIKIAVENSTRGGADYDESYLKILKQYFHLTKENENKVEFFEIGYYIQKPATFKFKLLNNSYIVQSLIVDGELVVKFENKYYKNIYAFYNKAKLFDFSIKQLAKKITDVEVIK